MESAIVGEYTADMIIDDKVIVELKIAKKYNPKDEPQLLNPIQMGFIPRPLGRNKDSNPFGYPVACGGVVH